MLSNSLYKLLCCLAGILNIALAFKIFIAAQIRGIPMLISPCFANIILALLLIAGVAKRRPSFIKIFLIFTYMQIVVLLLIAVYMYRLVVHGRHDLRLDAHGVGILIALFGLEAMIASGGLKAVIVQQNSVQEGTTVQFQQLP